MGVIEDDVPTPVRILGYLFLLGAIVALLHIVFGLLNGQVNLDVDVLGFWIGPGLVRGDPRWWTWALIFSWLSIAVVPIVMVFFLSNYGGLWISAAFEALNLWGLWVLYRHRGFINNSIAQ